MPFRLKKSEVSDFSALPQTPINPVDLDDELVQKIRDALKSLDTVATAEPATVVSPDASGTTGNAASPAPPNRDDAAVRKWQAEIKAVRELLKLPPAWRIAGQTAGWVLWLSVCWLFIAFLVAVATEKGWEPLAYPLLPLALGWAGVFGVGKIEKKWREQQAWMPRTLARIVPILHQEKPLDAIYASALVALLKQQAAWGAGATQNVLHDLKTLLHTGRQTAARRAEIEQAMNYQSVPDMEAEAARLAVRAESATDASARDTFKQSLALIEARLARAKSLEPLRQQLEAQEEVIGQALAEAQSALSGANLAHWTVPAVTASSARAAQTPRAASDNSAMETAPLAYLGDTVSRLRRQTESVEQAVREVVQVGGSQTK